MRRALLAASLTLVSPTAALAVESVDGTATFYCEPTYSSPCTAGHPPGTLSAAAGPSLRRLLGAGWRGRQVVVEARSGASVVVTLVDWCACGGGRVLDLYGAAFSALAPLSRGTIPVTVRPLRGPTMTAPPTEPDVASSARLGMIPV